MRTVDPVEAAEIRACVGWDRMEPGQLLEELPNAAEIKQLILELQQKQKTGEADALAD